MPLWPGPGVEVQEAGTGAGYASALSPLTPLNPGRMKLAMRAARASTCRRCERWVWPGLPEQSGDEVDRACDDDDAEHIGQDGVGQHRAPDLGVAQRGVGH